MTAPPLLVRMTTPGTYSTLSHTKWSLTSMVRACRIFAMSTFSHHLSADDANAALTSQTLNADGTPKRPMNAFMIFARRRRPQVAAENQSMRTGEVSKILSREWNAMSMVRTYYTCSVTRLTVDLVIIQSDKQFYLDRAKLLKDNFNQKYPDYVYKRRPNNSRKRRKPDPSPGLPVDHASGSDLVDDYSGSTEYSDVSPVDVADTDDNLGGEDVRYASLPADPSGGMYPPTQPRASSYQPPDVSYRSLGDARVSYISRPGRATPDTGLTSSIPSAPRGSEHGQNYYHPYLPAQHHHHAQSSSYFPDSSSTAEVWPGARDDQSRIQMQPWSQNSQDMAGDDRHRGYHQAVPSHGWPNTTGSEGISSSSSSGASAANYGFPTLNSPFYPPQNNPQGGFSSSSVQPIPVPSQPQHYGVVSPMQGNPVSSSGRSYPSLQQPFSSSSSSAVSSYQPQARTVSLTLPSGQPVASYPHAQSTSTPPPAGPGGDSSQMRYWPRER